MPGHEAIPGITCLLRHQVGHAGFTLITHHQWGSADGCHLRHNFLVAAQTRQRIPVAVSAFGSAHNAVFDALLKQRCPLFRILNLPKFGDLCQSGFAALCMFRAQLIKLFADVPGDILACFFRILCDHFFSAAFAHRHFENGLIADEFFLDHECIGLNQRHTAFDALEKRLARID